MRRARPKQHRRRLKSGRRIIVNKGVKKTKRRARDMIAPPKAGRFRKKDDGPDEFIPFGRDTSFSIAELKRKAQQQIDANFIREEQEEMNKMNKQLNEELAKINEEAQEIEFATEELERRSDDDNNYSKAVDLINKTTSQKSKKLKALTPRQIIRTSSKLDALGIPKTSGQVDLTERPMTRKEFMQFNSDAFKQEREIENREKKLAEDNAERVARVKKENDAAKEEISKAMARKQFERQKEYDRLIAKKKKENQRIIEEREREMRELLKE